MIEAKKSAVFKSVFSLYNTRLMRRHFSALHVDGLKNIDGLDRTAPIILVGNHSCWWDGLMEYYLATEVVNADIYLMMEERQLARYKFFRKLGAFSVVRESPRESVRSIRYAASLFDKPNRFLWVYPQGEMKPNDARPLNFFTGVARIAQLVDRSVQVVPFAHRYEFLMEQRPEAFTLFGKPVTVTQPVHHKQLTEGLEEKVTALLDTLRCRISLSRTDGFRTILRGMTSANKKYDTFRLK